MRSRAKAVNFGIVYGIGAFSLAKDIGVTRKEADQYIQNYLAHYSGVRRYMEQIVEQAREQGYVETIFGRRRYLPELSSSNFNLRSFGERVARNMPIQGAAADIIKIAMIRVANRLEIEGLQARLILQVHDELIVEAPEEEAEQAAAIVTEEMQAAISLSVPLVAIPRLEKPGTTQKNNRPSPPRLSGWGDSFCPPAFSADIPQGKRSNAAIPKDGGAAKGITFYFSQL